MADRDNFVNPDADDGLVRIPLPLLTRAAAEDRPRLLELAKNRAADPAIFEEFPPVFYMVRASDQTIDYYSTRMMDSTLRNYAQDATDGRGVPFLDSHQTQGMSKALGRSILGEFNDGKTDKSKRVDVTFYTQPTMLPEMQQFVNRARGGYAQDVSVGFSGGKVVCSICGGEMYRWWRSLRDDPCYHMPGYEYAVEENGKKTGKTQVAIGLIEDAHLGEISTVHNGANDNAGFLGFKARSLAEAGLLPVQMRSALESRLGIVLPGTGKVWTGFGGETPTRREREEPMAEVTEAEITERINTAVQRAVEDERASHRTSLRSALQVAGIEPEAGADMLPLVRTLADEVVRLRPQAEDGKTYKTSLITEALKQGVRAFGDVKEFDRERQRTRLERMTLDDIRLETSSWRQIGDKALPGDRGTVEGDGKDATPQAKQFAIPAAAYSSSRRPARRQ